MTTTPTPVAVQDRAGLPYALVWRVVRPQRGLLGLALLLSVVVAVLTVVQPRFVQSAVDGLIAGRPAAGTLVWLAVVTVVAAVAAGLQGYVTQRASETCARLLRARVVRTLLRASVEEHDRANTADVLARAVSDTALVRLMVAAGLVPVTGALVTLVGIVGFMVALDPLLVLVTVSVVAIACLLVALVGRTARETSLEVQERTGAFAAALERTLAGIRTVKAFNAEDVEERAVELRSGQMWSASLRLARLVALVQPTVNLCMQAALVIVVVVGAARVADGPLGLGGLLAYVMYMVLMVVPVSTLSQAFTQLQIGRAALARLHELDAMEPDDPAGDAADRPGPAPEPADDVHLELRHVDLAYEPGRPVLRDVSLRVRRGEKVAVVGRSGSGKTSIIELVEGFYEPDAGEVLLDGVPLDALGRRAARARIAYVPQDPAVLTGTLRENLTMGRTDLDDVALVDVLRRVGLAELVERSAQALDADLGQAGVTLSGGQRQRLAWARVLLSPARLVLLDEPTSNLDPGTEALMTELLAEHGRDRTVVTVTHRPETVRTADRVLVVDEGVVTAYESWDHVRRACPQLSDVALDDRLVTEAA
ncbi:ABC transporter ATP-binding protein [Cellulomonas sp.]|uniref:ABC transporter ATP-binding protein n=1 Tax=Cellulomonas sp. TaxID=40001 RepID=UPI0028122441|nr:ABC transporter ATP-binding protein [Cellulomonas sp.]